MNTESRSIRGITAFFPYLLLLIAGLGIGLTLALQRTDLTISSLILVVPLVIAGIVLIIRRNTVVGSFTLPAYAGKIRFSHLFLLNILIFLISLILLVTETTRPLAYFILISVFAGVIFWQILCQRPAWTDGLIIFEILCLSLNLIWGTTLKYPLYFGDTDTLGHLSLIDTILKTGRVAPNLYYQHYPLYHLFTAAGVEITGLSIRNALFVLMGLAWQAGILLAFLLFRSLTQSNKVALVACFIFASSSQLILYGSYAIARSLAFVFLLCWLYLIFNKAKRDPRFLYLSLLALGGMVLTHHVNVIYVVPILVLVFICQLFILKDKENWLIKPQFIYLIITCCIAYLLWGAFDMSQEVLPGTVSSIMGTNFNMVGDFTRGYGLSVILGALYYSFVILLCFLGVRFILQYMNLTTSARAAGAFAIPAFFMLAVYVPGPLDLLNVSDIALTYRFPMMVSPFVAFLAALGIMYLYNTRNALSLGLARKYALSVFVIAFISIMTFLSTISTGNAKDATYLPHTATIDTPYFTKAELTSYSFLNEKSDNKLSLYSDYETMRNELQLNEFTTKNILQGGDLSYISDGYVALRVGELERKKALTFVVSGTTNKMYRYSIDPANLQTDILSNLESQDNIYWNQDVRAFLIRSVSP